MLSTITKCYKSDRELFGASCWSSGGLAAQKEVLAGPILCPCSTVEEFHISRAMEAQDLLAAPAARTIVVLLPTHLVLFSEEPFSSEGQVDQWMISLQGSCKARRIG